MTVPDPSGCAWTSTAVSGRELRHPQERIGPDQDERRIAQAGEPVELCPGDRPVDGVPIEPLHLAPALARTGSTDAAHHLAHSGRVIRFLLVAWS